MSSSAFAHQVVTVSNEQLHHYDRTCHRRVRNDAVGSTNLIYCGKPSTHLTTYRYVTGRAGRITTSRKYVCAEHAQAFAQKHGCPMEGA